MKRLLILSVFACVLLPTSSAFALLQYKTVGLTSCNKNQDTTMPNLCTCLGFWGGYFEESCTVPNVPQTRNPATGELQSCSAWNSKSVRVMWHIDPIGNNVVCSYAGTASAGT
jgi:hypothetical protein